MGKPRKHAELIKAWADGAEIQYRDGSIYGMKGGEWFDCKYFPQFHEDGVYRIKPEPKPDEVFYVSVDLDIAKGSELYSTYYKYVNDNLKLTFDGETGKLKSAEVLE